MKDKYIKFNDRYYNLTGTGVNENEDVYLGKDIQTGDDAIIPMDYCEPITYEAIQQEFYQAAYALCQRADINKQWLIDYFMGTLFYSGNNIEHGVSEIEDTVGLVKIGQFKLR